MFSIRFPFLYHLLNSNMMWIKGLFHIISKKSNHEDEDDHI